MSGGTFQEYLAQSAIGQVCGAAFGGLQALAHAAGCKSCGNPNSCDKLYDACIDNPWQPTWNRGNYGPKKPCSDCYVICKNNESGLPFEKCPE
jgi:hypothetical protein